MIAGALIGLCGAAVGATGSNINQLIASGVLFGVGGGLQGMRLPRTRQGSLTLAIRDVLCLHSGDRA